MSFYVIEFSISIQSLSCVQLFVTHGLQHIRLPFITNSWSFAQTHVHQIVIPSNHLILCCPLLLLLSIFPSIMVFSIESVLHIRWPKYWSFSFSISPSNESVLHIRWPKYWSFSFSVNPSSEYSGLISMRIDWFDII